MIRATTLLVLVAAYVSVYLSLRNRSIRENERFGTDGILYDSLENVSESHDLSTHHFRALIFAPLNFVDQHVFGGPSPVICMMFELS